MPLKNLVSDSLFAGAAVLCSLTFSHLAVAQTAPSQEGCQAPQPKTDRNNSTGNQKPAAIGSGKLADCSGVLKPPSTGDSQMVAPAPDTGKTPVIPPSEVPKNGEGDQPQSK